MDIGEDLLENIEGFRAQAQKKKRAREKRRRKQRAKPKPAEGARERGARDLEREKERRGAKGNARRAGEGGGPGEAREAEPRMRAAQAKPPTKAAKPEKAEAKEGHRQFQANQRTLRRKALRKSQKFASERKAKKRKKPKENKQLRRMKRHFRKWQRLPEPREEFVDYFQRIMFEKTERMVARKLAKQRQPSNTSKAPASEMPGKTQEPRQTPRPRTDFLRKRPAPPPPARPPPPPPPPPPLAQRPAPRPGKYSPLNIVPRKSRGVPDFRRMVDEKVRRRLAQGVSSDSEDGIGLEDLELENAHSRRIGLQEDEAELRRQRMRTQGSN